MESGPEGVHADEREEHDGDGDDREPRHDLARALLAQAEMEIDRVDDPRDERPDLLGVPRPERGPRLLGPDGAGEDRDREEQEATAMRR